MLVLETVLRLRAYADRLIVRCDGEVVAEHPRFFGRDRTIYDPWHYLPVLVTKPGALRNGAPFQGWELPPALSRLRRKLGTGDDADRRFVRVLATVLDDGRNLPRFRPCAAWLESRWRVEAVEEGGPFWTPIDTAEVRFMWLMVFFDLPVRTKPQRGRASRFRQFLKKDGYIMLQLSVYARVCRGQDAVDKHIRRVRTSLPDEGSVRTLQVTDKQHGRMELMLGAAPKTEAIGSSQMVLL